jgi:hypothetical protein
MAAIVEGRKAPSFTLEDSAGKRMKLRVLAKSGTI